MLKMVGKPVSINPNKELLLEIRKDTELMDKSTIIVERKNVIYRLDAGVEILE